MSVRAVSVLRAAAAGNAPSESVVLDSQGRHLRRKLITLANGSSLLADFEHAVKLEHGDCLVLETGALVRVIAGEEKLTEVRGRDASRDFPRGPLEY